VFPDKNLHKIAYSDELVDIVQCLLKKDRTKRLGALDDVNEILRHPFFRDIDKDQLLTYSVVPPFLPSQEFDGGLTQFYDNYNSKQDLEETFLPPEVVKSVKKN